MTRPIAALLALAALAAPASADERKFAFSAEAKTLSTGVWEVEYWHTLGTHRPEGRFRQQEDRVEFEYGVTDRLTTAFYANFEYTSTRGVPGLEDDHDQEFKGVSNEWKYKLSDPSVDPVGLLLYGELLLGSDERELEVKFVANKRLDRLNFVYNLVIEFAQEKAEEASGGEEWEKEQVVQHTLGVAYEASPNFSFGLEGLVETGFGESWSFQNQETLAYFAGPNVSVAFGRNWATLALLQQVDLRPEGHGLDYEGHEKWEIRLVAGVTF